MSTTTAIPQHTRPLWYAALMTCCGAPLAISALFLAIAYVRQGVPAFHHAQQAFANMVMFSFPVTVLAMLVLGMPFVFWLRNLGRLTFFNVAASGATLGAVVAIVLLSRLPTPGAILAAGAACGLLTSVLFALIAGVRLRRVPA